MAQRLPSRVHVPNERFVRLLVVLLVSSLAAARPVPAQESGTATVIGQVSSHPIVPGDTLVSLGARHGVEPRTLAADNDMDTSSVLRPGRTLRVDNRHIVPAGNPEAALVINIPQRVLFHTDGAVRGFPIAPGRPSWPTPTGTFRVVTREQNPTWDVPASILAEARRAGKSHPTRVPPGRDNPLGAFWLGLDAGGIGIHGTNAPASIYRFVSHGCIRLHPDDIAWLFPRVTAGAVVALVYEPVLLTRSGDRVFLEVHPDIYQRKMPTLTRVRELAAAHGLTEHIDWTAAARVLHARHGVARDVGIEGSRE